MNVAPAELEDLSVSRDEKVMMLLLSMEKCPNRVAFTAQILTAAPL